LADTIRLARTDELDELRAIEREAAGRFAPYGLQVTLATIVTPDEDLLAGVAEHRLWAAADERDRPVGFALACEVGGNGHLDELDVLTEHGRRGLGAALVETVCQWARARGYPAVTLNTLRHIPWNAPFYEKLGFRVLAPHELTDALRALLRHEIERGLPEMNRVAMWRDL